MLEACSGVTNEKQKDGVCKRSSRLWSKGPRVTGAPTCAKCSNICSVWLRVLQPSRENWSQLSESIVLLGNGASPFIDEGDGLTSEREGVCAT